jgi:YggT family protein
MNAVIVGLGVGLVWLRVGLFWLAVALAAVFGLDWLVRTRRVSPFSAIARFFRGTVDPLLLPVERRIVRAGGLPSSAPWWTLAIVVVGGIILLELLGYARGMLMELSAESSAGPSGLLRVLIRWTFLLLEIAIIVRVLASWIRISPFSPWIRWSYALTEWMFRPLRRVVPPTGMFDLTPLIAWVLLSWILEPFVLRLVA